MEPRRWFPLLALVFVIGAVVGEPFVMALATMMGVVIAIAWWWRRHALDGVIYTRRPHYRRAFPGEEVPLQIEIENRKWLPVSWLRVSDSWPEAVGPLEEEALGPSHIPRLGLLTNLFTLHWFERTRREFTLRFRKRGLYSLGPAHLESGDVFGFYDMGRDVGLQDRLTVFPRLLPSSQLPWPTDDPFGEKSSPRSLYRDPNLPMGVRDYRPDDDFRQVHWPATARSGQLKSKVYQPVAARMDVVCLNVSTYSHHWEGTNPELLEHAIELAASLVARGMESGYQVGLISNGSLANSDQPFRILPARSTRQLALVLEALAGVTPLVTAPFARFLIREVPRLPYRASLTVISSVTPADLLEALLRLKSHGRRITLISLDQQPPPPLPGIHVAHTPFAG